MRKTNLMYLGVLLATLLTTTSCQDSVTQKVEKSYKTLTISEGSSSVTTKYTASIKGEQFVDIRPQVSGVITKIAINEGAKIRKGETLFIIDQVPYQAALDVAIANVKSAEASVATAKLNAQSGEMLYNEKVISENELLTLQNTLASAEATLAQVSAQEKIARNDLSYTVVKSPVDGVAGMINYRIGALVSSSISDPLVSVSNNDKMYAYFSISESSLISLIEQWGSADSLINEMDDVALILSNGSTYSHKGHIDAISGVIESGTGTVGLRAMFENPEKILRDGGNGTLAITTVYDNVIVVPKVATFEIQNKTFVYKVIDGKAASAEISILPSDNGKDYIVNGGVDISDVIVAEGAGLLREGTEINTK